MKKRRQISSGTTQLDGSPAFIDIFAGCGGLSLGLMQAGWKGIFAIEHDANAFQTLNENLVADGGRFQYAWPSWLPKSRNEVAEVLRHHGVELAALQGKIDMLVGGPPCQGFSSAGRRNPNDPRNLLVSQYLEFVEIIKPRLVVLENVRGITSNFTTDTMPNGMINYAVWLKGALAKDYAVSSRMLDTSLFGVPQKRHRYFVIAIRKDLSNSSTYDPFEGIENDRQSFLRAKGIPTIPVSSRSAISDLEVGRNGKRPSHENAGFEEMTYDGPLTTYQKVMNSGQTGDLLDTRLANHRADIRDRFEKIIEICHANGRLNISLSPEVRARFGIKKSAIRVLDPDSPSPTITSMPDDLIHYSEPRTLTVRETARLQSFPDWFAFKGKYTSGGDRRRKEVPRFTQVANAVPPLVSEAIGRALLHYLIRSKSTPPPSNPAPKSQKNSDYLKVHV